MEKCPKCGIGEMIMEDKIYLTYPATYKYLCSECGHFEMMRDEPQIIPHSQEGSDSKKHLAVYNYDTDKYDNFEITATGFKNAETGEEVESPFTERHLNEMKLQTELMKSALGEKDN